MCMEDIRIARKTRFKSYDFDVGTGTQLLLPVNPKRFALVFGNSNSGTITIGQNSTMVLGRGIACTTTSPPIIFRLTLEGDLVRSQWYAFGSGAGLRFTVYEVELMDE